MEGTDINQMTLHCRQCGIHIGLWYLHMRPIDDDYCEGCKEKKSTRLRREIAEAERRADGGNLWNPGTDFEREWLDSIGENQPLEIGEY